MAKKKNYKFLFLEENEKTTQNGRQFLQITYLIKDPYPEYKNNDYNSKR